ncbi:MAG: TadE/TadG family type IV pilus assembly protein [Fimbriiglobus sp.]
MIPCRTRRSTRRGGVTVVEMAILLNLFLMFLFGIFEYARYLYTINMATNATRDAARVAIVNMSNPATAFVGTVVSNDVTYPSAGGRPVFTVPGIVDNCRAKMAGADMALTPRPGTNGAPVSIYQVFPCDTTTLFLDPPTIRPKIQPDTTASPPITTATWNNARFTERVAVRIVGIYRPLAPGFLFLATSRTFEVLAVMGSEG